MDSSALVLFLTDRGPLGAATRRRISEEDTLAAPYLLDTEVASALLGMARGTKIDPTSLDEHFKTYQGLRVQRHETGLLLPRIRKLYANLSAYDATYVALAEAPGRPPADGRRAHQTRRSEAALRDRGHRRQRRMTKAPQPREIFAGRGAFAHMG